MIQQSDAIQSRKLPCWLHKWSNTLMQFSPESYPAGYTNDPTPWCNSVQKAILLATIMIQHPDAIQSRKLPCWLHKWLNTLMQVNPESYPAGYNNDPTPWCNSVQKATLLATQMIQHPDAIQSRKLPCWLHKWSNTLMQFDHDWDLISICIYTEFCIDQLRIPLGVQLTDATANGGLAPKPPEPGWYPQWLPLRLDGVSVRKDTQSYECFSLCYDDPAPGQGWPREGECGLPSLALRCLDSNSRLVLRYRFGWRNKDTISLDCVALVHPTLLTFIEY